MFQEDPILSPHEYASSARKQLLTGITVPEKAKIQVFLETGIFFIDSKNRSCKGHVFMSYFNKVSLI
jgi:hypothetical protein